MQEIKKIKVLKIYSGTKAASPFKEDQNRTLIKQGIDLDILLVTKGGVKGYLKTIAECINKVENNEYDIIHTHDIAAITSIFQRRVPIIMTFHGSDLKRKATRLLCNFASLFARYCILSNENQEKQLFLKRNYGILNSGLDLDIFYPIDKDEARTKMSLKSKTKIILFAGSFSNKVKNYALAKKAIDIIQEDNIEVIELKGYTREETMLLMNAADLLLVTSKSESGPNVTKEALACNLSVVSTKVGHPKIIELLQNIEGCFVSNDNPNDISTAIIEVLKRNKRVDSRGQVLSWDINKFAEKTIEVYKMVAMKNKSKMPKIIFP